MNRHFPVILWAFTNLALFGCVPAPVPDYDMREAQPGGGMTAGRLSERTYIVPGQNLNNAQKLDYWTGFSLFRDPWVIAPSSTTDRDGLGPLFNTRSCISCHTAGGRGDVAIEGISKPSALVLRLGPEKDSAPLTEPNYGGQLQSRAITLSHSNMAAPLQPEGKLSLSYLEVARYQIDGVDYPLRQPQYQLVDLAYGELAEGIGLSPRLAPVIYGLGLLDAISDVDLLAQEDAQDSNGDGISGRYNRVPDAATGELALGRLGLKAKHPNLKQQIAAAFRDDIGITSTLFPNEVCTEYQQDCQKLAKSGGHESVEIPDKLLNLVLNFSAFMAVPPARNTQSEVFLKGRQSFYQSGCASCHTPSYRTDPGYPVTALAGQTIWPYTDLALHDMGALLADGVREHSATGTEWRTPPLWGIGLRSQYGQQQAYLHDGRATSLVEAILWHGGEAERSKQRFIALRIDERQALIRFLNSI